jgi:phosphoribosylformylglycinamidine (FGAM) synthase-like enzyme
VTLTVPAGFVVNTRVILLGQPPTTLSAGEYRPDATTFPRFVLEEERRLGDLLRDLASRRLLRSAQDVADGGLAVALAECALLGDTGATLQLPGGPEMMLFSEDQGRAVVTCLPDNVDEVLALAANRSVPATDVGSTGGDRLVIGDLVNVELARLRTAWEGEPA